MKGIDVGQELVRPRSLPHLGARTSPIRTERAVRVACLLLFCGAGSGTAPAFDQSVDRQQDNCPNYRQHQTHQESWFG